MIKLISVINKIKDQKLTLSVAESCTGGKIASSIVSYEGASDFFLGGIVSYSVDSKIRIMNIDNQRIEKYVVENRCLDILTSTQTYRPQNWNIYLKVDVYSEFEVEHNQLLCLDRVV